MLVLVKIQVVVLGLLVATVWGKDFHGGVTIDWNAQDVSFGDVHVFPNSIWSMINNAYANFRGNIQIDKTGGLYISGVAPDIYLSATLKDSIHSFINDGIVSFNALKAAPTYTFWIVGNKFENNGDLFFSASGEGSVVSAIKAEDWHNNGYLHFYQKLKSDSFVQLGKDAKTLVNNGQVCFTNQNWHQLAGVLGTGCFTASGKSSFYLMNNAVPFSENQILYLNNGETSIMAIPSINNPLTYHVRGFGTYDTGISNKIGFTATLYNSVSGKPAWEYDAKYGILTLWTGLYSHHFEIGTGYDPTKFEIVSDKSREIPQVHLGAVQYNGPPPQPGMPPECKPCKPIPGIPGIDPLPSTTSTVESTTMQTSTASKTTSKHGLIKTVTVFETDVVMVTSTHTITSTVKP
ncbi:Hyphally regulated cell wall protein N-terminal family protein [Candida parapsilosis]|uniref:Hyphal_reg_CWP domain-containing protein n=2 Tax=Candida parapsilosis TaxID=5480 RepID=G8B871_CANPC|nr:uncharacterized protein CPAR2_106910 [Candida parapsilosis]KAF6043022.1 Hyphally regulated cell wall protein N-terminal family protein [Candida parapsilosis]KAF6049400.1 Hyphally regulated cell wall protein N-terminal family protein [Candida parapsilosis]KAF6057251.1 Hyphally regulated cell wall protein N-terminal family protein [Candida parapsilosis]KAF6066030.1 Hyphally regulated cell wall protein N-terminal family protein [Candida parapsilosis]KAI5904404.1 Cell wall protein IFF9 [Candida